LTADLAAPPSDLRPEARGLRPAATAAKSQPKRAAVTSAPEAATPGKERAFHLVPTPKNASFSLDGAAFAQVTMGSADIAVGPGAHKLVLRHPLCQDETVAIAAADEAHALIVHLKFKSSQLVVRCATASAITVDGVPIVSGSTLDIQDF